MQDSHRSLFPDRSLHIALAERCSQIAFADCLSQTGVLVSHCEALTLEFAERVSPQTSP